MDRRAKVAEARLALRGGAGGPIEVSDGPKFADFQINDGGALDEFYEAMRATVDRGARYRVRVEMVA
jgi:hypothetical protein